ncbi:hypothetical protein [Comamonas aquatica]|uniref:Uncharacterized protein n=1 Tax=Comamonas aquatica TaxID=225991 RepID=A0AA35GJV7_9BURK|nr:hypothetical protein [Comamonas aquatica]CAB5696639.1 Uncharacterised protein [Comamonas aquatica]CAC9685019.1 Uncharacterised protein [Comamonas aquatica]
MSFNPRTDSSSPPGHQDLDASLAAPAQVDQVGGTPTLEQFQRWLENKAHSSAAWVRNMEPLRFFAEDVFLSEELVVAECRAATKLLMQFKLEQSA